MIIRIHDIIRNHRKENKDVYNINILYAYATYTCLNNFNCTVTHASPAPISMDNGRRPEVKIKNNIDNV